VRFKPEVLKQDIRCLSSWRAKASKTAVGKRCVAVEKQHITPIHLENTPVFKEHPTLAPCTERLASLLAYLIRRRLHVVAYDPGTGANFSDADESKPFALSVHHAKL
jgi:hypothetical protein